MDTNEKKVDDDWKAQMQQEKAKVSKESSEVRHETPTFMHIISILATQAMFHLGEFQNPGTGQRNFDPVAAKFGVDMLQILKEKTSGHLTPEEDRQLNNVLCDLRIKYLQKAGPLTR